MHQTVENNSNPSILLRNLMDLGWFSDVKNSFNL